MKPIEFKVGQQIQVGVDIDGVIADVTETTVEIRNWDNTWRKLTKKFIQGLADSYLAEKYFSLKGEGITDPLEIQKFKRELYVR